MKPSSLGGEVHMGVVEKYTQSTGNLKASKAFIFSFRTLGGTELFLVATTTEELLLPLLSQTPRRTMPVARISHQTEKYASNAQFILKLKQTTQITQIPEICRRSCFFPPIFNFRSRSSASFPRLIHRLPKNR